MSLKSSSGVAKLGLGLTSVLILGLFLMVYIVPVFAGNFHVDSVISTTVYAPNSNQIFQINVTNDDIDRNITLVNVSLPANFYFIDLSNATNAVGAGQANFTNSSNHVIEWNNTGGDFFIGPQENKTFWFNASLPDYPGNYNFTVCTLDNESAANCLALQITVEMPFFMGTLAETRCNPEEMGYYARGCHGPAIVGADEFYYDGNEVNITVNFTGNSGAVLNLTVRGNFSAIGNGTTLANATELGGGLYQLRGRVNYSALSNIRMTPAIVQVIASNTTDMAYQDTSQVYILLVNMTIGGCPPADDPNVYFPQEMPWNTTNNSGVISVSPYACVEESATGEGSNCTAAFANEEFPPIVINSSGTGWKICGPNFGGETTNLSAVAQYGNASAVQLVLDIPGKAKISFVNNISFDDPDAMQGIMDFAMKSLMSRGRVGINDTEWNGTNISGRYKPKLNISAELTIYNVIGQLGITDPAVGWGAFNGSYDPTAINPCPATRCSNFVWDGENLTYTVSSFSTYIVGSTNHTLIFSNVSDIEPFTAAVNEIRTFRINIINWGNDTTETYVLNIINTTGTSITGSLNETVITLNSSVNAGDENTSILLEFNISNATAGTYYPHIIAYHFNGSDVETDINLSSADDGVNFTVNVVPFTIKDVIAPINNSNISLDLYNVSFNLTNLTVIDTINWTINASAYKGTLSAYKLNFTIADGNFTEAGYITQNVTLAYNDTWGNDNTTFMQFKIDNTKPYIGNISSPVANNANVSGALTINATNVTDVGVGIYSLTMNLTNGTANDFSVNQTNMTHYFGDENNGSWTLTLNTTALQDGRYSVTLIVRDWADNTNTSTLGTNGFVVDNSKPASIGFTDPTPIDSANLSRTYVFVNVTLTDATPDKCIIEWANTTPTNYTVTPTLVTGNTYNCSMNMTGQSDNNIQYKVYVNDSQGQYNVSETRNVTIDTTGGQLSSWNYSAVTKQLTLGFNETMDPGTIDLSKFNVTDNSGVVSSDLVGLAGATVSTTANSSVIIINLTTLQDTAIRAILSKQEGQIDMAAGAIKDISTNNVVKTENVSYTTYTQYGIEIALTGAIWNSFGLPRTVLENRTSLGGNYNVQNVLESISGNYAIIYYYNSTNWTSYVPGRITNDFTTFTADDDTHTYWVYMTSPDTLEIV